MWLVINLMKAARIYNEKVRQFPTKLAAMIFGFKANLTLNQLLAQKRTNCKL